MTKLQMDDGMANEWPVAGIRELKEELERICREMAKTGSCIPHYDGGGWCIDIAAGSDHFNHDVMAKLQERICSIHEEIGLRGHIYSRGQRYEALVEYWKRMQRNPPRYRTAQDAALSIQTG